MWCEQASGNKKEMKDVQGQVPLENNKAMNSILDESFHASEMAGIITGHYLVFFFSFSSWFLSHPPQICAFPQAPASWAQEEGESEREVLLLKTYS